MSTPAVAPPPPPPPSSMPSGFGEAYRYPLLSTDTATSGTDSVTKALLHSAVAQSLEYHLYDNALFLVERLYTEFPTAANLLLYATVYYRKGDLGQCFHLLESKRDQWSSLMHFPPALLVHGSGSVRLKPARKGKGKTPTQLKKQQQPQNLAHNGSAPADGSRDGEESQTSAATGSDHGSNDGKVENVDGETEDQVEQGDKDDDDDDDDSNEDEDAVPSSADPDADPTALRALYRQERLALIQCRILKATVCLHLNKLQDAEMTLTGSASVPSQSLTDYYSSIDKSFGASSGGSSASSSSSSSTGGKDGSSTSNVYDLRHKREVPPPLILAMENTLFPPILESDKPVHRPTSSSRRAARRPQSAFHSDDDDDDDDDDNNNSNNNNKKDDRDNGSMDDGASGLSSADSGHSSDDGDSLYAEQDIQGKHPVDIKAHNPAMGSGATISSPPPNTMSSAAAFRSNTTSPLGTIGGASAEKASEPAVKAEERVVKSAALHLLGQVCLRSNRQEIAIHAFKRALALNPYMWSSYAMLCQLGYRVDPVLCFPSGAKPSQSSSASATRSSASGSPVAVTSIHDIPVVPDVAVAKYYLSQSAAFPRSTSHVSIKSSHTSAQSGLHQASTTSPAAKGDTHLSSAILATPVTPAASIASLRATVVAETTPAAASTAAAAPHNLGRAPRGFDSSTPASVQARQPPAAHAALTGASQSTAPRGPTKRVATRLFATSTPTSSATPIRRSSRLGAPSASHAGHSADDFNASASAASTPAHRPPAPQSLLAAPAAGTDHASTPVEATQSGHLKPRLPAAGAPVKKGRISGRSLSGPAATTTPSTSAKPSLISTAGSTSTTSATSTLTGRAASGVGKASTATSALLRPSHLAGDLGAGEGQENRRETSSNGSSKSTAATERRSRPRPAKPTHRKSSVVDIQAVLAANHRIMSILAAFGNAWKALCFYECQAAIAQFSALPVAHYNTAWVQCQLGRAFFEKVDYKQAEYHYLRARKLEPYRTAGMEYYSTTLWHLRKEWELSHLAHELTELQPSSPEPWCVVGNCFSLQKEHESAISFFERATQADANFAYAFTLLGHEHAQNEDVDKALSCYRAAIRADARHYNAWYGIGMVYRKQQKYDLAFYHFQKALEINPNNSVLYCYAAMVLQANKQPQHALSVLKQAMKIDPKNILVKLNMAITFLSLDQDHQALQLLLELQDNAPHESSIHTLLSTVYKRLAQPTLAARHMSWAIDLDPRSGGTHQETGNASAAASAVATVMNSSLDGSNVSDSPSSFMIRADGDGGVEQASFIEQVERDTNRSYTLDRPAHDRFTSPLQDRIRATLPPPEDDAEDSDSDAVDFGE